MTRRYKTQSEIDDDTASLTIVVALFVIVALVILVVAGAVWFVYVGVK